MSLASDHSTSTYVDFALAPTNSRRYRLQVQSRTMGGPFQSKSFRATIPSSIASRYRKALTKHPFLLFGLPFLTTIVAGSFMLTPATALRYERFDRKNQRITQEEKMGLGQNRRKVNMKDEYYVSFTCMGKVGI